ncbi:glycoside hydrolase superfamily, partial [Mycena sp. CBHHK59/15]
GYGPNSCQTTSLTTCISNCDAKAECGPNADAANFNCPLNVCCSQWGIHLYFTFQANCTSGCTAPTNPNQNCALASSLKRVIGYYESWSLTQPCNVILPEELPVNAYTHIFFSIDPDTFAVVPASPSDPPLYTRVTNLKQVNPSLRVYISVGGWSFNDPGATQTTFSDVSSTAANRNAFVTSLIQFMTLYGFDGIDIDWEYPVAPERGGKPADRENFVLLMADIRAAFNAAGRSSYGITFTSPSSYFYMQNFDIPKLLQYADWVNVMTYDLHGTWDQIDVWIGPYLLAHTNITEMEQTLDLMWRQNIPSDRVVLGIGFYGRSFTVSDPHCTTPGYTCTFSGGGNPGLCTQSSGTLSYSEIMDIIASKNLKGTLDPVSGAKYVTWDTNQWVSYDDPETFEIKLNFADKNCLGGVMIWSADQDTLSFDALNGLLGLNALAIAENRKPMTTILSPNGQYCGATVNCGDPCPDGHIQGDWYIQLYREFSFKTVSCCSHRQW